MPNSEYRGFAPNPTRTARPGPRQELRAPAPVIEKRGDGLNKKRNSLSLKEKLFCFYYTELCDAVKAASKSGYSRPDKISVALLSKKSVCDEIKRIFAKREQNIWNKVKCGYEKLAFGSTEDAVKLMFFNNPTNDEIEKLDLFHIAEIKRPKEGAMEIKFFDRLKAIEKLENIGYAKKSEESDFYRAVIGGLEQNDQNFGSDGC